MSSRKVEDLDPRFATLARTFLDALKADGMDVLVTCTLRSLDEQTALYAQGRTAPGRIVTNAKPGSSAHNYGLAMDCCPLVNGKLAYNTPEGDSVDDPIWQRYGSIARTCGLEWAGDWKTMREAPHVQMPAWRSYIA